MPASSTQPERGAAFWRMSCVAMLLALSALGMVFVLHGELNADEGFYLLASKFVADGLRPFRDFGFTQTPLVPYANVPWLALFGYDLTGIRLAGLGWTVVAILIGVIALQRRQGWLAPAILALLLLGSPGWLAWATKGKTYAFSSLAVLLGAMAVTTNGPNARRWGFFIAAATMAAAARLTTIGFFLPAGVGLLLLTSGWRARAVAIGATGVTAGVALAIASAGAWESFWFWTTQFHAASTIQPPYAQRLLKLLALAPALWIVVTIVAKAADRQTGRTTLLALLSLLAGVLTNVLPPSGYAEYASTFIPALAWVVAPALAAHIGRCRVVVAVPVIALAVACGWVSPPKISGNVLQHASEASTFLATHTPAGSSVVASMPEIAVAAQRSVPPTLAMGKFAVTEDLVPDDAGRRRLLTPATLSALLRDPATRALVFSSAEKWNFSWSVPNYHYLSRESRTMIFTVIQQDYELVYTNPDYVIFLRKHRDE